MNVRRLLNGILRRFGYQITKFDALHDMLMREFKPRDEFSFVQIGANDGVTFDTFLYPFVTSRRSRGLVLEPLTIYYNKLEDNYSGFPDIKTLNLALHATQDKALIHYVDPDKLHLLKRWGRGIGSLDPEHHKKKKAPSEYIITEEVRCVHLMDLLREHDFFEIDLLQIDAEGYDGEIIKMIDFAVTRPRYIRYEHVSLEEDDRLSTSERLRSQGYEVFEQGQDSVAVRAPDK